ncbi:MAG: family 2A encapsulin nanocompartment cargo protein cysteine desulfurase [Methylococcales bacterium]|nr:family 2A encapsulin nanocompartment cargo protein cysteine desulfurase [Methylococcales bacterium]
MTTSEQAFGSPEALGLPDAKTLTLWANALYGELTHEAAPAPDTEQPATRNTDTFPLDAGLRKQLQASVAETPVSAASGDSAAQRFALPSTPGLPGFAQFKESLTPHPVSVSDAYYFLTEAAPGFASIDAQQSVAKAAPFDIQAVRGDFPILKETVNGKPLVWFDNAATTHKPNAVIQRIATFYAHENSNIHRAAHELAARATDAYEKARQIVADFLHASSVDEIVFVRGTTEAINLVAQTFGRQQIRAGDEIIISYLEHHANIVPWKQLCDETGAVLKVIPVDDSGQVILSEYQKLLSHRTRLVSFTHVANALGTITPAQEIIELAHRAGAKVLLDAAQSVSHLPLDVSALDVDFLVFSGHKIYGPTGIGVLYGKADLLEALPPWQGGGNMIEDVRFDRIIYQPAPAKFEAGTGNIADAVGLGAALEYLSGIGLVNVAAYEHELLAYATEALQAIPGLRLIGTAPDKTSVLSFVLKGHDNNAVGQALNQEGIAVRTGHHCAQPILRRFGLESTVRPSLAFYNTYQEIDLLVDILHSLSRGERRG